MKKNDLWMLGLAMICSSCRLGNLIIPGTNSPTSASNNTPTSSTNGFYVTQPKSLKFYATLSATVEKDAPTDQIPHFISQYITNPVALWVTDASSGLAGLAAPTGTQGFPIYLDSSNHLSYSQTTTPRTFWQDPACQRNLLVNETGTILPNPGVTSPPDNTLPLSGSILLTVQIINQFQGTCAPSFSAMHQCYLDSTQCGGTDSNANATLQAQVIELFAPWIQSQTIQTSDIPNLSGYAYEVSYQ